jgi:predicted Zn-dependent protease
MSYYAGGFGDPYEQPRGPNLRWIVALIIAVIGIATYLFQEQVNPVTGKRQHIAMDVDQEMRMGLQAAPEMAAKMGGELDPRRDPRAAFVVQVGRRIVERSDASQSPYVDNYHFHLLDDPETVNAFALPGGQVFITRGLFNKLENEAELAGVLSHEIGHVVGRHSAEQMAQGRLGQTLAMAVGVGASGDSRGREAAMVAALVNQMAQLKFSRSDESEADTFGLKYMAQAGYDPSAMLNVMEILKNVSKGSRQPEFLATHPLPETRLEEIRSILQRDYPNGIPDSLTKGRALSGGRIGGPSRFDYD